MLAQRAQHLLAKRTGATPEDNLLVGLFDHVEVALDSPLEVNEDVHHLFTAEGRNLRSDPVILVDFVADVLAHRADETGRLLKADVISLKLAGRPMEEIEKTLGRRYEDQLRRARQAKSRDVFSLYMNTFANLHDPHTSFFPPRDAENFDIDMKLSLTGTIS